MKEGRGGGGKTPLCWSFTELGGKIFVCGCDVRYAILGSKGVENSRRMLEMVLEVGG